MIYINRLLSVIFHEAPTEMESAVLPGLNLPFLHYLTFDLSRLGDSAFLIPPTASLGYRSQGSVLSLRRSIGLTGQLLLFQGWLCNWSDVWWLKQFRYWSCIRRPPVRRKKSNHSLHCGGLNMGYESKPQYFKSIWQKQDSSQQHRL